MNLAGTTGPKFGLLLILLIAAAARMALYAVAPHVELPDTTIYIETGNALFASREMSSSLYMPLYPAFIHLAGSPGAIWIQIALSTATVFLVYRIAATIWESDLAGLLAAALCALHPMLIYFSIARLTETPATFLLTAGIFLLYRREILLASICLVLLNLTRPTFDFAFPFMIVATTFATETTPTIGTALRRLAVFASVYIALMGPWWLHNYHKYGHFVRLNLADGITLILENSESYEHHGADWSIDPPWGPFSDIADPVKKNEAMKLAALDFIKRNPALWLRASIDRLARFFAPWPPTLTENSTRIAPALVLDTICAVVIAPVFFGALFSLFWIRRRWRAMLPILIPIVYLTVLHSATYVVMRYRIPIDPLLIALAGGPLAFAASRLKVLAIALLPQPAARSP